MNSYIQGVISLIRPKQWIKNGFVLLPLFFGHKLLDFDLFFYSLLAFLSFSCISSAVYSLNDIHDMEYDRLHPSKCNRPLASGLLPKRTGWIMIGVLLLAAVLIALATNSSLLIILAIYFFMNVAYTLKLKQLAIVDVCIIAIGFVLRLYAGSVVTGIPLSEWIVLMTFLLAMFLGFAKRRDDVLIYEKTFVQSRKNILRYNKEFLNVILSIITAVIIMVYIMYCVSEDVVLRMGSHKVYFTAVFVILGLFRYLQLTLVDECSGSPTQILYKDSSLQISIICWVLTFYAIIYV